MAHGVQHLLLRLPASRRRRESVCARRVSLTTSSKSRSLRRPTSGRSVTRSRWSVRSARSRCCRDGRGVERPRSRRTGKWPKVVGGSEAVSASHGRRPEGQVLERAPDASRALAVDCVVGRDPRDRVRRDASGLRPDGPGHPQLRRGPTCSFTTPPSCSAWQRTQRSKRKGPCSSSPLEMGHLELTQRLVSSEAPRRPDEAPQPAARRR